MTSKTIIIALVLAFAAVKGAKLAVHWVEPPTCHSDPALKGLVAALHDPALKSVAVNNATTVAGGFLSGTRICTADLAPLRAGIDAAAMTWKNVVYEVRKSADPDQADVTATVGESVPLAPVRSDFARWVEYFLD